MSGPGPGPKFGPGANVALGQILALLLILVVGYCWATHVIVIFGEMRLDPAPGHFSN